MVRLEVDGRKVSVAPGSTVLEAAAAVGVEIPTLCFAPGTPPSASCMVCGVWECVSRRFLPACAFPAAQGMVIEATSERVHGFRRQALELLLSEHVGDCAGPCQQICPAGIDIPLLVKQVAAEDLSGAFATLRRRVALPATLARICPAPCEKGCRRAKLDGPVAIAGLEQWVADRGLEMGSSVVAAAAIRSGKRVAVVGAGPAGLSCASFLLELGHEVVLLEAAAEPGGAVRQALSERQLPPQVLEAEIAAIIGQGAELVTSSPVDTAGFAQLRERFAAVVLASGSITPEELGAFGLETTRHGVAVAEPPCE